MKASMGGEGQARRFAARWAMPLALVLPAVLLIGVFLLVPLARVPVGSLWTPEFTLAQYARLLGDPAYGRVLLTTLRVSALNVVACALLGYPVALVLWNATPRTRERLFLVLLVPYWISVLVRNYAWIVLLQRRGVVNSALQWAGITDGPVTLLYNEWAVVLGMTHYLLPFMVLTIYSVLDGIDRNLLKSAATLGARPVRVFWHVLLPLSAPGVASGALLVFVISLAFYITPALLGGPKATMFANLIAFQIREALNWPFAFALATTLVLITIVVSLFGLRVILPRAAGTR